MAWGTTKKLFGTCGNFKFEIYSLTDVKATRSLIKPGVQAIKFVASTNTSDGADIFNAKTLAWTGTADGNTPNELVDSSETFDSALTGYQVSNTTDNAWARVEYKDADELYVMTPDGSARADLFPDGNEAYTFYNERVLQLVAQTAGDDGTLIIIG